VENLTVNLRGTATSFVGREIVDLVPGFETGANDELVVSTNDELTACTPLPDNGNGVVSVYAADVVSAQDYAPFGMQMVGRTFNSGSYRYGFNGKENDNEVKVNGDQIDYGMRIYDPRVGRFLSVDPLRSEYPNLTVYQFASNSPIAGIDKDGGELELYYTKQVKENGKTHLELNTHVDTYDRIIKFPAKVTVSENGITFEKRISKEFSYSELGINEIAVDYNGEWRVLPEGIDYENMPSYDSPVWETFETIEEFNSRVTDEINSKIETANKLKDVAGVSLAVVKGVIGTVSSKGIRNPITKKATNLGNKVHYDKLNGGTGNGLPSELTKRYPKTQFRFSRRGQKGADVEVVGGLHPSKYPNSTWKPGNDFGDFKPNSPSGIYKFLRELLKGKLPNNTERLLYDKTNGKLL